MTARAFDGMSIEQKVSALNAPLTIETDLRGGATTN